MQINNLTGIPIQPREFMEAIATIDRYVSPGAFIRKLPNDLEVQIPNIRRCLVQGLNLTLKQPH